MIFRYPAYYDKFTCIADRCEDTCCAGWEIDIDDESYQRYMDVEGELGEALRLNIREYEGEEGDTYEKHGFRLKEGKRCPFLDENNLCVLYRELGEDSLCSVCTDTPRNYLEYGTAREVSLSASCPEAARLIYGNRDCIAFVEKTIEGTLDIPGEDYVLAEWAADARDRGITILQNRKQPLEHRILSFLSYAELAQECLNRYSMDRSLGNDGESAGLCLPEEHGLEKKEIDVLEGEGAVPSQYTLFLNRVLSFTGMESVNREWESCLALLNEVFADPSDGEERYLCALSRIGDELIRQKREYEYEHLMVYYAFMCLPRCVDDGDFLGKAKMAVVSFLMIRDIDAARLAVNGCYTVEDRLNIVRIYAKEVEHSGENLEYLSDAFLFEEAFRTAFLCKAVCQTPPVREA